MTKSLGQNFHPMWAQFTDCESCTHPSTKPDVISKYCCIFQKNLDTKNYNVLWLQISVPPTFTGWAFCPNKLSVLFIIKGDTNCTSNCHCGLTQYVPTDPVPAIPIQSAHCMLPLLLSSRLLPPLMLLCIYTILRHTVNSLTVNMHWQTAAWYSVLCLIVTGPVRTAIAQYVLQHTVLPMLLCKIRI